MYTILAIKCLLKHDAIAALIECKHKIFSENSNQELIPNLTDQPKQTHKC